MELQVVLREANGVAHLLSTWGSNLIPMVGLWKTPPLGVLASLEFDSALCNFSFLFSYSTNKMSNIQKYLK